MKQKFRFTTKINPMRHIVVTNTLLSKEGEEVARIYLDHRIEFDDTETGFYANELNLFLDILKNFDYFYHSFKKEV